MCQSRTSKRIYEEYTMDYEATLYIPSTVFPWNWDYQTQDYDYMLSRSKQHREDGTYVETCVLPNTNIGDRLGQC